MPFPEKDLFTNRIRQLQILEDAFNKTSDGLPARIAFLGLRRIGKSLLFSKFVDDKRARGTRSVVVVDLEGACTNPELFCQVYVGAIARQVLGSQEEHDADYLRLDTALATDASASRAFARTAGRILSELGKQPADQQLLIELALMFPEDLARETGEPILLFLDEFQYLFGLRKFSGAGDPTALFRARIQKQKSVGYVIAGSAVSVMEEVLSSSANPLFGMFRREMLGPFNREDTFSLVEKVTHGLGARAKGQIHAYTGGNPYYVVAVADRVADLLRSGVEKDKAVDFAFLEETITERGRIHEHLRYQRDVSLERARGAGNLKAILQVLAEEPEGLTISEIARKVHKAPQPTRNYLAELLRADMLYREEERYYFRDPVFKFWIASQTESILWSATPTEADLWGSLNAYKEKFARLSTDHGISKESEPIQR